VILDAPIGTRLIARGMRPQDVVSASFADVLQLHRADVAAGADTVLTNTFALPFRAFDLDVSKYVAPAIACAQASGARHVLVSLGPPAQGNAARNEEAMERVLTSVALALRTARVMGVLLETLSLSDQSWLPDACARLRADGIAVALSFIAGTTLPESVPEGVFALGANCSLSAHRPEFSDVLHKAKVLGLKSYLKPAIHGDASWLVETCAPFDMVGVCCGGDSSHVAALASARVRGIVE